MIYSHRNVFYDAVTMEISVGEPPAVQGTAIPPVPPAVVRAIQAVVTRKCNLRCSYCNVMLSGDTDHSMTMETADEVIRVAREAPPGRLLMVTGGEPLLVPDVTFHILRNVASPVVVFTNATLITADVAAQLKKTGVSPVVSMDGTRSIHDSLRCNSWDRVACGLDNLSNAGVDYGISMVSGHTNWRIISSEMEELYRRFRPVSMGYNILHWTSEAFNPISGEEYMEAIGNVFRTALKHGIFVDQIARRIDPLITGEYRHRDCAALGGKIVFHPDGSISNCISGRTMEDWSCRIPAAMEFCRACHAAGICGGGCSWDGLHLGNSEEPDPRHCLWVKHILDLFLEDVAQNFPHGPVSRKNLRKRYSRLITRGESVLTGSIGHGEY